MDENIFSGEQLDELDEQGFTEADIYFLETLNINHDILYDNIIKDITDGLTYEEIMDEYRRHNPNNNRVPNVVLNPLPLPNHNRNRNQNLPKVYFASKLGLSHLFGGKRNKTKRNKTKRNKTKRNKTKRNKTKRNKTKK
jgi:hypothetical protein